MGSPLLQAKLGVPPSRPGIVPRPALIARLEKGLAPGSRVILISAPAGFGKTTLVSEWIRALRERATSPSWVAWVSLDTADNDAARFWAYLSAALERIGIVTEEDGAPPGPSGPLSAGHAVGHLAQVCNELIAIADQVVLVLDDYHLLEDEAAHGMVRYIIDHQPPSLHLVIATRADPPLPIARLRARGQLVELRQGDLRFTAAETTGFLRAATDVALSSDDVAGLAARTEGWVAGLQMAALAIASLGATGAPRDASAFVRAFAGSHRYVMDYLVEEVLLRQPPAVQAFLTRTAILNELCAPLCGFVLETTGPGSVDAATVRDGESEAGARAMLEYLDRANLFVPPLDDRREWYRYHRLFSDLLRARLLRLSPDLVPQLHSRASEWYESRGSVEPAIEHALSGRDWNRAVRLIEGAAETTLMRGEIITFLRWVDSLPDELVSARSTLCALSAWALVLTGRPLEAVEARLRGAEEAGDLRPGAAMAVRALVAAFQADADRACALASRALAELPADDRLLRGFAELIRGAARIATAAPTGDGAALDEALAVSRRTGNVFLAVIIMCNQAELYVRRGRLEAAFERYRRALELATDERGCRMPMAGQALIGMGDVARERNDLDAAARYLEEGLVLIEGWSEVAGFDGHISLARTTLAQRKTDQAWAHIGLAREIAERFEATELDDRSVALAEARMGFAEGDLAWVRDWARSAGLEGYITTPLEEGPASSYEHRILKYELPVLARLLIAEGRERDALSLLEPVVAIARWRDRRGLLAEVYILQALARRALGRRGQASGALARALRIGEAAGFVRIFLDEGKPLLVLLREAASSGSEGAEYARRLLAESALRPAECPQRRVRFRQGPRNHLAGSRTIGSDA